MPDLYQFFGFMVILIGGELITNGIFYVIIKVMKKGKMTSSGVFRGFLERVFLYFCMVNGIYHALTLFGALKIATHIKDDDRISNDYFLIGNLISVFAAIGYLLLFNIFLIEFVR